MSAETAAGESPDLDAPEDPETVVFVAVGGLKRPERFHSAPDGDDKPPCWQGGGHSVNWERRRLGNLLDDAVPCRRCYGDPGAWAAGTNNDHDAQTCPLCGADGVSVVDHLATPSGRGCPATPMTGGESSR